MKIHEYQAKEIFRRFGVPTPRGEMVTTPDQARAVAERLGTKIVVVKAQIHAGGRGKAGGVKLAKSPAEAADLAKAMLGMKLVTPQTGPTGHHAITGLAWPHDRQSCIGQVRQVMQTGGPSRVSHRPCLPQAAQMAGGLLAQRSQRSGWPPAARSRTGRSRPHPPHRRGGGPLQLRQTGPSGRNA